MSDSTDTPTDNSNLEPAPRKKTAWMIALGVVLVLVIAGAGWAVLYGPDGSISGDSSDGNGSDEASRAVESTRTIEDTSTVVIEAEGGDTDPDYDPNADPALIEQYTAIVTDVRQSGGSYTVTLDYVQFLTGDEAKAAAEAHGDPMPASGLYAVNDNPLTRNRSVSPDLTVRVTVDEAGKPYAIGRSMSVAEWASAFDGPQADIYRDATYIVTLTNGTVTLLDMY